MRWLCTLVVGLAGCASGDEPATMPTGFASASATATATATSPSSTDSGSTSSGDSGDDDPDPDPGSGTGPDDPSGTSVANGSSSTGSSGTGGESSTGVESEQPEDGMYSACDSVVDCIGLTACLTAMDTSGQAIEAFCTAGSCDSPLAQCAPSPGGTAVPVCLEAEVGGVTDSVCALDCSQGQECPAGMECRTLTGGSICS